MRETAGVVVAGGTATRFGERDKALVPVEGTPMVVRVVDRLTEVVDELVVNCREDQREAIAAALDGCDATPRFAHDPVPDCGPVAGLRTGFRVAAGTYAVAVPCDMPYLDPTLLAYLRNRVRSADAEATVPRFDGFARPLCAAYRVEPAREACERATQRTDPALRDVLAMLDVDEVPEAIVLDYADRRSLADVDRPADLEATTDAADDAVDADP